MREIKFRAWDNVLGLCSVESIDFAVDCVYVRKPIDKEFHTYTLSVENSQLMQYTGLHDKNGKEIYEGDIVKMGWPRQGILIKIEWNEVMDEGTGFIPFTRPGLDGEDWENMGGEDVEVIGNIYENPELIEKT
jgi:uncharacterized phage protein (TIGR01671 family)